jgi:hypothetical protein
VAKSANDIADITALRFAPCGLLAVAAISVRTHKKDSLAAPKPLPFNDFSHFPNAPWHAI